MVRRRGSFFGVAFRGLTGTDAPPLAVEISDYPFAGANRVDGCLRDG